MLRVHLMQNWFSLSDPGMEDALYDMPALRKFARLSSQSSIPDETTILNFRRLIEEYELAPEIFSCVSRLLARKGLMAKHGTMVDATIIDAPSSTKNADRERDPQMRHPIAIIRTLVKLGFSSVPLSIAFDWFELREEMR